MATFQVSHAGSLEQQRHGHANQNRASTSYLHLSGHGARRASLHATRFDRAEEYVDEDADMLGDDGVDALMDGGSGQPGSSRLATAGQTIASTKTFMRGHGAYVAPAASRRQDGAGEDGQLICSSLCGVVRRTNKLISVASLKTRYAPEVGDLVIGRITDLQPGNRRWKVDIQSRQEANLLLSSINLPGGIQRRKLESDELEMRTFFKEGDLLVCEVQSIFNDGSTSLHTRSLNYGKLRNGQMATVNPCLVRRLKSHFVRLEDIGLEVLIGLNGVIWVAILPEGKVNVTTGTGRDIEAIYSDVNEAVSVTMRQRISRMLKVISLLARNQVPISDATISQGYDASTSLAPLSADSDDEVMQTDDVDTDLTEVTCRAVLEHVRSVINDA